MPASVTDAEAMLALNEYFRKNLNNFNGDAVYAGHLEWFENLPKEFPVNWEQRDYSQDRQVTITGVVNGTRGENRTAQASALKDDSLVFSDPRDQAIAVALHACKHNLQALFKDLRVRRSVPWFALGTNRHVGVRVNGHIVDAGSFHVAASGSSSPK